MNEQCQRCLEIDEDRRTLMMACFYEMDELMLPFKHQYISSHIQSDGHKFYTLRVCKRCRADWMLAISAWFEENLEPPKSPGSGIFIRVLGDTREVTEEQWEQMNPGVTPVRFKG